MHNGHLRLAVQLRDQLGLSEVRLVPSARPPHREQPGATPGQRAKWIRVAISVEPGLELDDRELIRPGLSYTIDTLASFRAELPDTPLCLVMGSDVFAELDTWHRWTELLDLCHIIRVPRPGSRAEPSAAVAELMRGREVDNPALLADQLAGLVYEAHFPLLEISGTDIRQIIARGHSPRFLLPLRIWADIDEIGAYRALDKAS